LSTSEYRTRQQISLAEFDLQVRRGTSLAGMGEIDSKSEKATFGEDLWGLSKPG